ncbi:COP9 signalosome complex subunit 1 [Pseudomassariella vexata]|uniref:COP9 signalosome complex subunit 1 n=1 Tax=Pseudomassariella vexata TaxID=1141098 RepID=A0A1Y2EER2_9PEZI|nr:COP9 signalosome complex subunit 1 [Pseudomassariella vexata]ORY70050.1 COP9 signalosome complex subunit 1 [Pseudomassariella vexata]
MADSSQLLTFFTAMDNQGGLVIKDAPKLDLDLYISNYTGRTRFERLFSIGQSSVVLCVDALKAAVTEAKRGKDVRRYREAWECIRVAAPNEPEAQFDQAWADKTEKANKLETHRLETELKGYKNNLVKESIRIGYRDLGEHLESIGDLTAANDNYTRMRPEASTHAHLFDWAKHAIGISLQKRDWSSIQSNINKMLSGSTGEEDLKVQQPYQKTVLGLANLHGEKFYDAAKCFLEVELSVCQQYSNIMSPNDMATYGGLLALASMDRSELQSRVLDSPSFRNYLELEPHIRKATSMFVNGRYSACLATLESYRADYLLDIHLSRHVKKIYSQIRSKCIVQYFIPFSCVTLDSLDKAFAKPGESLEAELITMIKSGALKARIDTVDKLLMAISTDRRAEMQANALEAAKNYEKEALERIRRMNIVAADLEVKGTARARAGLGGDQWFNETRRQMNQGEAASG